MAAALLACIDRGRGCQKVVQSAMTLGGSGCRSTKSRLLDRQNGRGDIFTSLKTDCSRSLKVCFELCRELVLTLSKVT